MSLFKRVAIVGLGLIGGSLGMALRRRRIAQTVVGYSRTPATMRRARACGAIDTAAATLQEAVRDAELVVLAMPVGLVASLGSIAASHMRWGAVLTDVGSTKRALVERLESALRAGPVAFVGGHPLAGSEQRGIAAARADMFDGSVCILTRTPRTNAAALATVKKLWTPLVKRVVVMSPERHDALLAATSHLPHLIAWSLTLSAPRGVGAVIPPSFLEMTRIAKSDPDLWDDILLSNRRDVVSAVRRFERELGRLRVLIARGNAAALTRRLAAAKSRREALHDR